LGEAVRRLLAHEALHKRNGASARRWLQANASIEALRTAYEVF
jgi:hypothetical protein